MTYQEFKSKNMDQYLDYDKQYRCECWDLIQFYNTQVLNVPDSVFNGCQVVKNMILWDSKFNELLEYFDEVSVYEMNQGDVCIWTEGWGGHVAVFDSWDGYDCWYFSQDPDLGSPCTLRTIEGLGNPRAFRRKGESPSPVLPQNVQRDEYKNQIKILKNITELNIRSNPSVDSKIFGKANPSTDDFESIYDYFDVIDNDNYKWYKIGNDNWIAYSPEWEEVYPAKEKEDFIKVKVLDRRDGFLLVDLDSIWIKEK